MTFEREKTLCRSSETAPRKVAREMPDVEFKTDLSYRVIRFTRETFAGVMQRILITAIEFQMIV